MIDNKVPLKCIEDAFADALEGNKNLNAIAKVIKVNSEILVRGARDNDISGTTFDIKFVDGKDQFLGMCVYPTIDNAHCMSACIQNFKGCRDFVDRWKSMTSYIIEIDENLFDRSIIAFNPQELTAMLMHEISHVIFSSKKAEQLYACYIANREFLKMTRDKAALSKLQGIFYEVPMTVICGIHEWNIGKDGMMEEWICDQVFGMTEYQEHMVSALNKIIRAYGTTIITQQDVQLHNVDVDMKWCNLNIRDIVRRREMLRSELLNRSSRARGYTLRHVYLDIIARLGIGLRDRYTNGVVAMEAVLADIDEGAREFTSVLSDYKFTCTNMKRAAAIEGLSVRAFEDAPALESLKLKKAPKLPSDYAIDEISIEIDKIENHYDRIYVLDLIYNRLSEIDIFESYYTEIGEIHKYAAKIKSKRDYLEKLREAVLEKKILDKDYTVFVKCPKGYEG